MFRVPHFLYVQSGAHWYRMRPSIFCRVARHHGNVQFHKVGRLCPPPLGLKAPEDDTFPINGPRATPHVHRTNTWSAAHWRQALERLDMRPEQFLCGGVGSFDVVRAKGLAMGLKRPVKSGVPDDSWWHKGADSVTVEPHRLEAVKFDAPVIFAEVLSPEDKEVWRVLIDGNHRATRAMAEKREIEYVTLPLRVGWLALRSAQLRHGMRKRVRRYMRRRVSTARVRKDA